VFQRCCKPSAVTGLANILNVWIIMRCPNKDSKLKIRDASQGITVHKSNFENQLWYIYLSIHPLFLSDIILLRTK
jgi:hypothetical protein